MEKEKCCVGTCSEEVYVFQQDSHKKREIPSIQGKQQQYVIEWMNSLLIEWLTMYFEEHTNTYNFFL